MPSVKFEDDCLTADDVRARNKIVRDRLRCRRVMDILAERPIRPTPVAVVAVIDGPVPIVAEPPLAPVAGEGADDALSCLCLDCRSKVAEAMQAPLPRVLVEDVIRAVSRATRISDIDIKSQRRTKDVVAPRHLAMALAKQLTLRSLPYIGSRLGGRDHTTVLHAARKYAPLLALVEARIGKEAPLAVWVDECWSEIQRGLAVDAAELRTGGSVNWHSGFDRVPQDRYETPDHVSEIILPYIRHIGCVWEPACASGKMARVLGRDGHIWVTSSDIEFGTDFLVQQFTPMASVRAIVTNPPYARGLAQQFVEHALELMKPCSGLVAMLLPEGWDMAQERAHLFEGHPAWRRKIAIRKRIRWFEGTTGNPRAHHCWMIWDHAPGVAMPTAYWPPTERAA